MSLKNSSVRRIFFLTAFCLYNLRTLFMKMRDGTMLLCKYISLPNKERNFFLDKNFLLIKWRHSWYISSTLVWSILSVAWFISIWIPRQVRAFVGGVHLSWFIGKPNLSNKCDNLQYPRSRRCRRAMHVSGTQRCRVSSRTLR